MACICMIIHHADIVKGIQWRVLIKPYKRPSIIQYVHSWQRQNQEDLRYLYAFQFLFQQCTPNTRQQPCLICSHQSYSLRVNSIARSAMRNTENYQHHASSPVDVLVTLDSVVSAFTRWQWLSPWTRKTRSDASEKRACICMCIQQENPMVIPN